MSQQSKRLESISRHLSRADMASDKQTKSFARLVRFECEAGQSWFHDLGVDATASLPAVGDEISAFSSFDDLLEQRNAKDAKLHKFLAPLPYRLDLPIYCIGVNYRLHAEEANLTIPSHPVIWLKPSAALAAHKEDILINEYCASTWPDYEGEFVFVTSKECRDVTTEQAEDFILGYTIGNDLSCRLHQTAESGGGQFTYAKGFDQFGPIGPVLINRALHSRQKETRLTTRVNGEVLQTANCFEEFIWSPAQVLSHMSQGTTIPAGTAIMTGTPPGVGVFQKPPRSLQNNDVVTIEVTGLGILENRILYK